MTSHSSLVVAPPTTKKVDRTFAAISAKSSKLLILSLRCNIYIEGTGGAKDLGLSVTLKSLGCVETHLLDAFQ